MEKNLQSAQRVLGGGCERREGGERVRRARGVVVRCCRTWHGSMPGKSAHVGLMRLFVGRLRAVSTTCVLKARS